ncbi:MAG: CHAT domain-containing protein [Elusimicrobiota bacterium]|nr:CHAT domain-containing protein [Elusimicrobiota bacterium]
MTVQDSIIEIQEEYKKPKHGNFIRLLEDAFNGKLSPEDEFSLARVAREHSWQLRWEHKFEDARTCFSLALDVFKERGDICEAYKAKKGKSICDGCMGFPQEAIDTFKGAMDDLRKLQKSGEYPKGFDPDAEIMKNYFYLSIANNKNNDLKEAKKCLDKAMELTGDNIRFRGLVLQGHGKLLHLRGRYNEAIGMMKRASEVFKEAGNDYKVMNVSEDIATNLHYLGRYTEAIEEMNKVIEYYEKKRVSDHWAYFHRAASLEKLKRHKDAKKDYVKAVETFEKLLGDVRTDQFRRTFSSSRMVIYESAAMNALAAGEPENAYMLLQKAKARSFIEMMINRHFYGSIPVKFVREIEKVQIDLSKLEEKDNAREVIRLRMRLAELIREVEHDAAKNRENISLEPLDLAVIRKKMPQGTLALDFLAGESKTVIFAVSRDTFEYFEMDAGKKELGEITFDVNDFIVDAGTSAGEERELKEEALKWYMRKVSSRFPEKLMKELIPSCENLVIVPHSSLHRFPFCLLIMADGRYLTEEKPVYYIDNIQRIGKKALAPDGDMFVVSDPTEDLSSAGEESDGVKLIFGAQKCRVLKGSACRRKSVLSALEKYSMFHFAGHAVIEESQQDMSRLLLSDGALRVSGLFGRKIKSRFVFLNGCQTARGKVLPGDEMNSFSRAFHFAGADEVIVNLWEVSDSHSPIMTKLFYESFSRGLSSERALQEAQKHAIAEGLSPFVWAAFKIIK